MAALGSKGLLEGERDFSHFYFYVKPADEEGTVRSYMNARGEEDLSQVPLFEGDAVLSQSEMVARIKQRRGAFGVDAARGVRPLGPQTVPAGEPVIREVIEYNPISILYYASSYYNRLSWIFYEFERQSYVLGEENGWPIYAVHAPIMENIVMSQLQFDLRSCTAFFANDVRFSKFYEKFHPEDIADAFLRSYGKGFRHFPPGVPLPAQVKVWDSDDKDDIWKAYVSTSVMYSRVFETLDVDEFTVVKHPRPTRVVLPARLVPVTAIAGLNDSVDAASCDYVIDTCGSFSGEGYALTIDEFMQLYGPDGTGEFPPEPGASTLQVPMCCADADSVSGPPPDLPLVGMASADLTGHDSGGPVLRLRGGTIGDADDPPGQDGFCDDGFADDAPDDPGSWAYGKSIVISAIPDVGLQQQVALLSGLGIKDPPVANTVVLVVTQYDRPRVMRVDPRCHSRFLVGDECVPDPRYFSGFLEADLQTRVDVVAVPPGVVRPGPFRDANDRQFTVPLTGKLRRYYLDRLVLVRPDAFQTVPLLAVGVRVADVPVLLELGDRVIAIKPQSIVPPEALSLYPAIDTMTFDEYVTSADPETVRVATEAIASSLAQFAEAQYALG